MPQVNIDFSDIEEFEALPAARYSFKVESVTLRESQSSENPYLNWELTVTAEPYANRRLFMITSLSPKALWRLKAVFEALGVYQDQMQLQIDEDSQILISPPVVGKPGIALVSQEGYDR